MRQPFSRALPELASTLSSDASLLPAVLSSEAAVLLDFAAVVLSLSLSPAGPAAAIAGDTTRPRANRYAANARISSSLKFDSHTFSKRWKSRPGTRGFQTRCSSPNCCRPNRTTLIAGRDTTQRGTEVNYRVRYPISTPAPYEFGSAQCRYTRSDAGTLCGPLEPTVTLMLIVRYYQNGGFAATSSSRHPVMLVTIIPLPPVTARVTPAVPPLTRRSLAPRGKKNPPASPTLAVGFSTAELRLNA